jgi:hypothetical protein
MANTANKYLFVHKSREPDAPTHWSIAVISQQNILFVLGGKNVAKGSGSRQNVSSGGPVISGAVCCVSYASRRREKVTDDGKGRLCDCEGLGQQSCRR